MIQNQKKHKEVKFHKVNFNNAKKIIRNETSNKMIFLKTNHYLNNKEKEKTFQISAIDNLIRNVEDKYSTLEVNNLLKAPKRNFSSKKINNNNKNLMNKKEQEESKNGRNYQLSKFLKIGQNLKVYRKYNSCKKLIHFKKFCNINKDTNSLKNEQETYCNNISKGKKRIKSKKDIKIKKDKFYNEVNKLNDNNQEKEKYENFVNKKSKILFCCL